MLLLNPRRLHLVRLLRSQAQLSHYAELVFGVGEYKQPYRHNVHNRINDGYDMHHMSTSDR